MKFTLPTLWVHGKGSVAKTGEILADKQVKHALIVTDEILIDAGLLQPIFLSLEKMGIAYTVCDKVQAEPTVAFFDDLVKKFDLTSFDAFVAVGGGSVIDTTKGLRVVARQDGSIREFAGIGKVPPRIDEPLIAIPTTSGTGSEISNGAVFSDEENKTKFAVIGLANFPTVALTDPEMTKSMPPFVTAMSGIDALVHAIESYVSRHANLVTEMFALRAIELIGNNLERAVENGNDMEAREAMQLGSTLAMVSAYHALLGLCHAIAMPLCALYKLPHGQACGVVLPYVLDYNSSVVPRKVEKIFELLGYTEQAASEDPYRKLENFIDHIGLSIRLRDFGYVPKQDSDIVAGTLKSFQSSNNPREVTEKAVLDIVKEIQ